MPEAASILRETLASYKALRSYIASGSVTHHSLDSGKDVTIKTSFFIRLGRPNRYNISWSMDSFSIDGQRRQMKKSGTVWNAGRGAYLLTNYSTKPERRKNDRLNLAGAHGISGGVTYSIPALFFGWGSALTQLRKLRCEGRELLDGAPCVLISGTSRQPARYMFWILMERKLLTKIHHAFKYRITAADMRADKRIVEQALAKAMKTSSSEEQRAEWKEATERALTNRGTSEITPEITEVHTKILTNMRVANSDFAYSPDQDTHHA